MKTSRKNKNVKESLGGKWKGTIMVAILMKINVAQYFSYLTLCTKWVLLCCLFKLFKSDVELERSQISQVEKLIKPIPSACIGSVWSQPEAKKRKSKTEIIFILELSPSQLILVDVDEGVKKGDVQLSAKRKQSRGSWKLGRTGFSLHKRWKKPSQHFNWEIMVSSSPLVVLIR